MLIESIILTTAVIIGLFSVYFIPRHKILQAHFVFLFTGLPAWILGLMAVDWNLLQYPYRELSSVNRSSFIFEYLILPLVCVHFNAHYPEQSSKWMRAGYYFGISSVLTGFEYIFEQYTLLIEYNQWEWWWTLLSVTCILYISRIATVWFFKDSHYLKSHKINPE